MYHQLILGFGSIDGQATTNATLIQRGGTWRLDQTVALAYHECGMRALSETSVSEDASLETKQRRSLNRVFSLIYIRSRIVGPAHGINEVYGKSAWHQHHECYT